VIHRDIKPANILLQDGSPLVADFGIALAVGAAGGRLTETGLSVGTPYYMSPEQATADREASAQSDIYSLGCVLYETLLGEPPYTGSSAQAVLSKILTEDVPVPRKARGSIPLHVDAAIRKAVEKLPADRFHGAGEFAGALGNPGFRYGDPEGRAGGRAGGRAPRTSTLAAAVAMIAIAGFTGWIVGQGRGPETGAGGLSRFDLTSTVQMESTDFGQIALDISPEGRRIVVANRGADGLGPLSIRSLDDLVLEAVPGTEGAGWPAFAGPGIFLPGATTARCTSNVTSGSIGSHRVGDLPSPSPSPSEST
jgi:serine/threonine-protein kinase